MDFLEAKFDGGRFDKRRWYVDGYADHWFTTEEDAKAAIGLAGQIEVNAKRELGDEIRLTLNKHEP